jgi:hypothetical protein
VTQLYPWALGLSEQVSFLTAVMQQRVNIKFRIQMDKTPVEIHEVLQSAYGDEVLRTRRVYDWFKRYNDGCENDQDDPRSSSSTLERQTQLQMFSKW